MSHVIFWDLNADVRFVCQKASLDLASDIPGFCSFVPLSLRTALSSLGLAIFPLLCGFLMSPSSSPFVQDFGSLFLLLRSFGGKSLKARITRHLLNPLLLCLLFSLMCLSYWSWSLFRRRLINTSPFMNKTWQYTLHCTHNHCHRSQTDFLETQNAPWRRQSGWRQGRDQLNR